MTSTVHRPIHKQLSRSYTYNLDRGEQILTFLKSKINLHNKIILDIGSGSGVLTIPFSRECKTIYALDNQAENLDFIANREDNKSNNIKYLYTEANKIPLNDESIDFVLINGVLEWMGNLDTNKLPDKNQLEFLREITRVLKKNGIVYIGIENRLFYKYLLRDPHQNMLFVNLFPRWLARIYAEVIYRKKFYTYIYSLFGYRRLMKKVNLSSKFFIPISNYQYPAAIVSCTNKAIFSFVKKKEFPLGISQEFKEQVKPVFSKKNILKFRLLTAIGILKYVVPSYSIVCKKN